jgi:hypothetical protein
MSKDRSPWQGGRRAWERLNGWHQDGPTAKPGHPDDGDGALTALADVGFVRHLLDQAELVAVRTARQHGKSWAEIATKLGVTRQSAWERWRDLDETPSPQLSGTASRVETAIAAASAELTDRAAREQRRRATIVVPNLIGMSWHDARHAVQEVGLFAVAPDPDGPPLATLGGLNGVVTDQSPESGAKVPAGSTVTLWLERGDGGSAGVREPRRPKPNPKQARELRYEPSDEAVG